ncbi:MAG: hypothetical protein QXF07_01230 [Candidatus Micrarchaeia archaeon]
MANYNQNFNYKNYDDFDDIFEKEEKEAKKIKSRQMNNTYLLNETIMRLSKSEIYKNYYELKPFIDLANKFEEREIAISIIHNCHVMRINNNHPSTTKRVAAAIEKALGGSYSIKMLEPIAELLSSRDTYDIKDDEIKEIKEKIKKQKSSIKARLNKMKENKKNQKEERDDMYEEEIPSKKELKKIEREFGNIINGKDEEINIDKIE